MKIKTPILNTGNSDPIIWSYQYGKTEVIKQNMATTAIQENNETHVSRTDEITGVLKREILLGQYRPGERLPSERDLADRFQTSRGTVRETFKKLEQLGIASIQPGGARVVPVEKATLDVLGTLLGLHYPPDPKLVDQVMEVFGVLIALAASSAVEKASDEQIADAIETAQALLEADVAEQDQALRQLAFTFIEISEHLVLQLVMNGLQTQFINDPHEPEHQPVLENRALTKIITKLQSGLKERDGSQVTDAMKELNRLIRDSARKAFDAIESNR